MGLTGADLARLGPAAQKQVLDKLGMMGKPGHGAPGGNQRSVSRWKARWSGRKPFLSARKPVSPRSTSSRSPAAQEPTRRPFLIYLPKSKKKGWRSCSPFRRGFGRNTKNPSMGSPLRFSLRTIPQKRNSPAGIAPIICSTRSIATNPCMGMCEKYHMNLRWRRTNLELF